MWACVCICQFLHWVPDWDYFIPLQLGHILARKNILCALIFFWEDHVYVHFALPIFNQVVLWMTAIAITVFEPGALQLHHSDVLGVTSLLLPCNDMLVPSILLLRNDSSIRWKTFFFKLGVVNVCGHVVLRTIAMMYKRCQKWHYYSIKKTRFFVEYLRIYVE